MASTRRLLFNCRRRLTLLTVMLMCGFLGYTGVTVLKSSTYFTYNGEERGPAGPPPSVLEGRELLVEEVGVDREAPLQESGVDPAELTVEEVQPRSGPPVVLVLSSMPRGGSTLVVEMLSAIKNSVVLFEPLWIIEKTECFKDKTCVANYLNEVFSCSFKSDFESWLKSKGLFFRFFNDQARLCLSKKGKEKDDCLKDMDLRKVCSASSVVLVKVVRARLEWFKSMLEDSVINLKVIHLTRDPRGSLNSIATFGWDKDPHSRCSGLQDDLKVYEKMRQLFPDRVMQVQYEQLCLRPLDVTKDMFKFLFDAPTLPSPVNNFLKKHMLSGVRKGGNMSTFHNSTQEVQAWRLKIKKKYLKAIEEEPTCRYSIQHMGHAVFGSHAAAKNMSIPLILNTPT